MNAGIGRERVQIRDGIVEADYEMLDPRVGYTLIRQSVCQLSWSSLATYVFYLKSLNFVTNITGIVFMFATVYLLAYRATNRFLLIPNFKMHSKGIVRTCNWML